VIERTKNYFEKNGGVKGTTKSILFYTLILLVLSNLVSYLKRPDIAFTQAPSINATLLSGSQVNLEQYHGKPLMIHFWATWCPTCKVEAPTIDTLAKEYQVITVAVNSGSNAELKAFMNENGYTFPVINDQHSELSKAYHISAFPTTYILDEKGAVSFIDVGFTSNPGLRLRLWGAK
jgi:thiol-disulfide isomerase/thioredoxin